MIFLLYICMHIATYTYVCLYTYMYITSNTCMQRKAGEESKKRAKGLAKEIEPPTPKPSTAGLYTARMYSPLIFVKY